MFTAVVKVVGLENSIIRRVKWEIMDIVVLVFVCLSSGSWTIEVRVMGCVFVGMCWLCE